MKSRNKRSAEDLRNVGALSCEPRDVHKFDRVEVVCSCCHKTTCYQMWQVLQANLRKHGYAWRCEKCYAERFKSEHKVVLDVDGGAKRAAAHRTNEQLVALGLVDSQPRLIRQQDRVDVFCTVHPTDPKPTHSVIFNNLIASHKRCGVAWRCPECVKARISQAASARIGEKNSFYGRSHSDDSKKTLSEKSREWFSTAVGKEHAKQFGEMVSSRPNSMTVPEYRAAQWEATHTSEFIERATKNAQEISSRPEVKEKHRKNLKERMLRFPDFYAARQRRAVENAAKPEARRKARATIESNGGYSSIFEKARLTTLEKYGVEYAMQDAGVRKRSLSNSGKDKAAKKLVGLLISRGYKADTEVCFDGFHKSWDVVVYEGESPVIAIDIDGQYFHGGVDRDPLGANENFFNDPYRGANLPDDVKYLFVDSTEPLGKVLSVIRDIVDLPYEKWVVSMLDMCKGAGFPYPRFDEQWLRRSWENLKRLSRFKASIYGKSMTGNSLVSHFHPSIYHANANGKPSPVSAWSDPRLLEACVRNRFIYCDKWDVSSYHVARGFEANRIAPRVSLFQPAFAKLLLMKYAPDAKTVVDPFAGYSGRLLGSLSLGLDYVGYELNATTVEESSQLMRFLGLTAKVIHADSLLVEDPVVYDVLLTCPPYGKKEIWGDKEALLESTDEYVARVLSKFKAKKYVFVVDKTERYVNNIAEVLRKKSHYRESHELVLVFEGAPLDTLTTSTVHSL